MRRRDFLDKLLGVLGVAVFPVMSASSDTVSGEEFELYANPICPECGFVMYREEFGKCTHLAHCVNHMNCSRYGEKYRVAKVRMERV